MENSLIGLGYTVYVHVNKSNGKKYFGITKRRVDKRWKNGRGYCDQDHFHRAIKKYGWNGFDHLIIATGLTAEKAEEMERDLILKFHSMNSRFGYNKASGGNINKTCSEETKRKLSIANKKTCGENHPMYGKKPKDWMNKETYDKWIAAKKGLKGKNNPMYGKKQSNESRLKNSLAHIGKGMGSDNGRARKVICLNNELIFGSVIEAAKKYNIKGRGQHICSCCNGRRKSCGKDPDTGEALRWAYVDEKEDINYGT